MKQSEKDAYVQRARQYYGLPLMDLIFQAHQVHRQHFDPADIQRSTLLSIKTGGCPENCSYCPQSAHYDTGVDRHSLLSVEEVRKAAQAAKEKGSQRFCMGAAWRNVKDGPEFDRVLEMVSAVKQEGLETCATLGMLRADQATRLKEAGLDYYNHNLDTSPEFYSKVITTRKYEDRLETIGHVRDSGIKVCCGGILGMGEGEEDRCQFLAELASFDPQPESVPINLLIPISGTPLENAVPFDSIEWIRTIAVARLLMPKTRVRLSAGRVSLNREAQILAFFAGANSIFLGEKLLTRENPAEDEDWKLLNTLQ